MLEANVLSASIAEPNPEIVDLLFLYFIIKTLLCDLAGFFNPHFCVLGARERGLKFLHNSWDQTIAKDFNLVDHAVSRVNMNILDY